VSDRVANDVKAAEAIISTERSSRTVLPSSNSAPAPAPAPAPAQLLPTFGSLRVELLVLLFPLLLDPINIEVAMQSLSPPEAAQVLFRLGWLSVWTPLKAEGFFHLDLSRREERQVMRALCALGYVETGQNWQLQSFLPDATNLFAERPPQWDIPLSWFNEATFPSKGLVALRYYSGGGVSTEEQPFKTAVSTRVAFTALSLPSLFPMAGPKTSLAQCDALLDAAGLPKLSFDVAKQQALKGMGMERKAKAKK
jgi:hypothetical protein